MYDDRLFDTIMAEMMNSFGPDVRTDEGSLAYNACAKIAEKLEDVYGDMDLLSENMLPDTQDLEHLIRYASERGIAYSYATAPIVKGSFKQEIEVGELFDCGDYTYEVTELIGGFDYKMRCQIEGTEANANVGELTPVDYIDDYLGGEITELLVPGTDDEDEEKFREKVINSFQSVAFGGNKADYRLFVDALKGVGGCKPLRRAKDSAWINIYLIGSDFGVPSAEVVNSVQSAVDPEENHGEGEGIAPICHNVKIIPVTGQDVKISTKVIYDAGFSADTTKPLIEEAVKNCLLELRKSWEANEKENTIVRLARIEAAILNVEGVVDITSTKINGADANLTLDFKTIPVFGGVELV